MKRLLIALLALLLCLSFCACADDSKKSDDNNNDTSKTSSVASEGSDIKDDSSIADDSSVNDSADDSSVADDNSDESSLPAEDETSTPENNDSDFLALFGTYSNGEYINNYLDLKVELLEGMAFYSEDELEAMYGADSEVVTKKDGNFAVGKMMIPMTAANVQTGSAAILQVLNVGADIENYSATKTEFLADLASGMKLSLEASGATDITFETIEDMGEINGITFDAVISHSTLYGFDYYQTIVCYPYKDYIVNLSASCLGKDITGDIFGCFIELNN